MSRSARIHLFSSMLILLLPLFICGCKKQRVEAPAISYNDDNSVRITCSLESVIYYTIDGSLPYQNSKIYNQPIPVKGMMTIRAIATRKGFEDSPVAELTVNRRAAKPEFDPPSGLLGQDTKVTIITREKDGTTYFSTNGSTPEIDDAFRYTGPFEVPVTTRIKAFTVKKGMSTSPLAEAHYKHNFLYRRFISHARGNFGAMIDISEDGSVVAISANLDSDEGENSGAVYIFTKKNDEQWKSTKVTARNNAPGEWFGKEMALSGDGTTLAVGAKGYTALFIKQNKKWKERGYFQDATKSLSLSHDGKILAIGNTLYEYDKVPLFGEIKWKKTRIAPSKDVAPEQFGASVALSHDGKTIAIGAPSSENSTIQIMNKKGQSWRLSAILHPSDNIANNGFGTAIAMSRDKQYIIAGAAGDDEHGENSGAVYLYTHSAGQWAGEKIIPDNVRGSSFFGSDVSISDNGKKMAIATGFTNSIYYYVKSAHNLMYMQFHPSTGKRKLEGGNEYGQAAAISSNGAYIVLRGEVIDSKSYVYLYELR